MTKTSVRGDKKTYKKLWGKATEMLKNIYFFILTQTNKKLHGRREDNTRVKKMTEPMNR